MHLADELGMRPEVDRCVECDRVLEAQESFRWVPPLGGVLCERCPGPPAGRAGLGLEALEVVEEVGGKNASLGEMISQLAGAGLPDFRDARTNTAKAEWQGRPRHQPG